MTKWIENLSMAQKIFLRGFFMVIGIALMVIVFYAGSREMLLLTDKKSEWSTMHWIFLGASLLFISLSLALNRVVKVYDLIIEGLKGLWGKFTNK